MSTYIQLLNNLKHLELTKMAEMLGLGDIEIEEVLL